MDTRKLKDKAQEAFSKGRFAKAAETYAQYCEADPSDLHARLRMGDAWSKAGQKEKAIGAYSWAAEGFAKEGFLPRAIAASKLILELDPAHKGVQKMLADLYARKNQPAKKGPAQALGASAAGPSRGIALEPEASQAKAGAAAARGATARPAEPPSPMNRADAIELPPDEPVPAPGRETAAEQKQRRGFELRPDAIALPEASPPLARAPGPGPVAIELDIGAAGADGIALDVATVGGSSATAAAEIEIAVIDSAPSAPPPPRAEAKPPPTPQPSAPPIVGIPLDGPLDAPLDGPLDAPVLLDKPKRPAPPAAEKGAVYELDTGGDESLESYAASLGAKSVSAPAPEVPAPQPSAPIALEVELEPHAAARAAIEEVRAEQAFSPEALAAPAPQASLPPPSLAVPSIAPLSAAPPAVPAAPDEAQRPAGALPPGLKPRRPAEPAATAAAAPARDAPASDARIWLPPNFAPPSVAPLAAPSSAPPAVPAAQAKPAATDLEKSLEVFAKFDVDAPAPARAPAMAAAPGFTELELEGESLLHAVESAAEKGSAARGEAPPAVDEALDSPEPDVAAPGALPKIPLFSDLPEDAFIALFESCPLRRKESGELVVEQGTHGDALYVICAGSVRVFKRDAGGRRIDLAKMEEGAFFGEMALLSDRPRSASVEAASEDTQLLEISAPVLAGLSKQYPTVATALKKFCRQRMLSNLMGSAALFQPFSKSDRRELVQKFRSRDAKKGEVVIREGQRSDGMYVILSGEVDVTVGPSKVASLQEGDVFGEMSLLTKAPATATVTTARHTSLLRLPREDFDMLILSHPQILVLVSELTDERKRQNARLTAAPAQLV